MVSDGKDLHNTQDAAISATGRSKMKNMNLRTDIVYFRLLVPVVTAEPALFGPGCSRQFVAFRTVIEKDTVPVVVQNPLPGAQHERIIPIVHQEQHFRVMGQQLAIET